jgi:hypothetical protein
MDLYLNTSWVKYILFLALKLIFSKQAYIFNVKIKYL